ncbi:MAG: HEAT repeat domain-containing protein [Elusimicrobia bacterium]|nr:HEAT repeat domain-containing protein [Elusimicrobiota bacterium]
MNKRNWSFKDFTLIRAPEQVPHAPQGLQWSLTSGRGHTSEMGLRPSARSSAERRGARATRALVGVFVFGGLCAGSVLAQEPSSQEDLSLHSIPALVEKLKNPDPQARKGVAEVLAGRGAEGVPEILRGMKGAKPKAKARLSLVLERIGSPAVPRVLEVLIHDPDLRSFAGTALNQLSGPESADQIPAFLSAMQDPEIKNYCGTALLRVSSPKAKKYFPEIANALKSQDEDVRAYAAVALGLIGDKNAVPHLVKGLKDPQPKVRWSAALALGKIGSKSKPVVEALRAAQKDPNAEVRRLATEALKEIRS